MYEVRTPELTPADHLGAGDSMTAGVAAVLARGGDMPAAIRTGAAAGALNVTRHGLGTGRADGIKELLARVDLVAQPAPALSPARAQAVRRGSQSRQVSPEHLAQQARPR